MNGPVPTSLSHVNDQSCVCAWLEEEAAIVLPTPLDNVRPKGEYGLDQ